jgi:hypothetical protein
MYNAKTGELIIDNWQQGIAESALVGFGDMRNVDIYSQVGSLKVNPKTQLSSSASPVSTLSLSVDPSTDIWTSSVAHNMRTGTTVVISSTGALPSPLSSSERSYVIYVSATTFKIANSLANALSGTALDITTAGTGTITGAVTTIGRVAYFASDPADSTKIYAQDDQNKIWYTTVTPSDVANANWYWLAGNTSSGTGNGLVVWKGYIFAFGSTKIDLVPTSYAVTKTSTWAGSSGVNDWFSPTAFVSGAHHAVWGQDDILYFTNGQYVGSVQETAGSTFAPGTSSTYNRTDKALTLPAYVTSTRLEELGTNLMTLGADQSNSYVFPWDRSSPTFNLPLRIPNAVSAMTVYNNTLYLFTTDSLKIYKTNGSYMVEEKVFPQAWLGTDLTSVSIGAATMYKGRLLFSISQAGMASTGPNGVYSYDLRTGALIMENGISTGNYYAGVQISALYAPKQTGMYFVGWKDNSGGGATYGVDSNRLSGPAQSYTWYSSYAPYVETQFFEVGKPQDLKSFQEISILFSNKLASTQGIRLSFRTSLTDSYTVIDTYDFATLGAVQYFTKSITGFTSCTHIQFKIELTDTAGTMGLLNLSFR